MSFAVETIAYSGVPLAILGGVHMPIVGAANIGFLGFLFSSSGLNQLVFSEDGLTISVSRVAGEAIYRC